MLPASVVSSAGPDATGIRVVIKKVKDQFQVGTVVVHVLRFIAECCNRDVSLCVLYR